MKLALLICGTVLLIVVAICSSVSINNYHNRDRPHVYSADELYIQECAKKGGNYVKKSGTGSDGIYINEKRCEEA